MTSTPTRRTVLRATAWTAPVVAVAATAPAFAASTANTFRINTAPSSLDSSNGVKGLEIGVHNPTSSPLSVTVFVPYSTDPRPYSASPRSWTFDSSSDAYLLTTVVPALSDSSTFFFGWYSETPTAKDVTLTASATGLDPASTVVTLRFDQPLPAARRAPSTGVIRLDG
ncbi:hypothetical protein ACOACO_17310 [Nocardioides sp. CPCC 205120]|uniref:hypothetical protein n=1 Tax=Nocardioides sp. CPCC 205120 TaxID=3406462 RepID=UPI003B500304